MSYTLTDGAVEAFYDTTFAELPEDPHSKFWIKIDNYYICFDISNHKDPEQLDNLHQRFIQGSSQALRVDFGIDDYEFNINCPYEDWNKPILPDDREYSTYWFSCGQSLIECVGRPISIEKITTIFRFIQTSIKESKSFCFGINNFTFSPVCEYIQSTCITSGCQYSIWEQKILSSTFGLPAEHAFLSNITTSEAPSDRFENKFSQFWIKSGDFDISLVITHIVPEELQKLHQSLIQKTSESENLPTFGIDNNQFHPIPPYKTNYYCGLFPENTNFSTYWFSCEDLCFFFNGQHLSERKIKRIFDIIKFDVEVTGVLQFGVDNFQFSHIPDYWS